MQSPRELIIEPVGLDVDALPRPIDWREMFGNDRPVELEIGMGKGTFITEQARARPEVNFFVTEFLRDESLSVLHVYFPDPWPKARHHKRRLIQDPFLRQAERVLVPHGR